jgi:ribonuclease VapC
MIVLDSSALMAILLRESKADALTRAIDEAGETAVCTATILECHLVTKSRIGETGIQKLDALISQIDPQVRPFDADMLMLAREVFDRFGKAQHKARLNFGDCIAYSLSKAEGAPLLFVGSDFALTDVEAALP